MPDLAEVEQGLAAVIAGALYPGGTEAASAVGTVCRVYRGWPTAAALEADVAAGVTHVSVQPVSGSVRDTTRFAAEWQGSVPVPTLRAVVAGEVVSFVGLPAVGQVAGVLVDGVAQAYRVRAGDTVGVVAAVLASLVRTIRPAELRGETIVLPGGRGVVARVVADGVGGTELRRQSAGFRVTVWAPGPDVRDRVAGCVDVALAAVTFLDVSGWGCRVQAGGGAVVDSGSAAGIWRRDLVYRVEYPTVQDASLASMLFGECLVNGVAVSV